MKVGGMFGFKSVKTRHIGLLAATVWSIFALSAQATILVGTVVSSKTETVTEINNLIDTYNTAFSENLDHVNFLVDKLEDQDAEDPDAGAIFVNSTFVAQDFNFYQANPDGTPDITQLIFDASVGFDNADLVSEGFFLDNPIFGFEQLAGPTFDYYVSKSGRGGWSLWLAAEGFNPSYTDSDVDGFTLGVTTNQSLEYNPISNGVSHISFYSTGTSGGPVTNIPAPATLALLGVGLLVVGRMSRRSRRYP